MKKKIAVLLICMIMVFLYGYRVYYVNSACEDVVIKTYPLGTKVPYEKDFNKASNMCIEGYSVEVLDSKVYGKEEFIREYNISSQVEDFTKYFYVIDVRLFNDNKETSTDHGIFLLYFSLISTVDYIMPEGDICLELNPNLPDISFALRHESSMDVKIAYALNEPYFTSEKQILNKDFKLLITQYPTRKLLEIK